MLKHIGVYCITSPSGKSYVGMSTKSIYGRWKAHRNMLKRGVHACTGLQNAYIKYGVDELQFSVLQTFSFGTSDQTILLAEQAWWDKLNLQTKLYNARPTGTGSVSHSEETKLKIRQTAIKSHPKLERQCLICGCDFIPEVKGRRKCTNCFLVKSKPLEKQCAFCGKYAYTKAKYCSIICYDLKRSPTIAVSTILELKQQNLSLREIGIRLGCSHTKIAKILNASVRKNV